MAGQEQIVVVEDEDDLRRVIAASLTDAGYGVVELASGGKVLETVKKVRPILVTLDLMLPDVNGGEVCRRLRAEPDLADLGILMVTARGEDYDRVLGFELGADDYLVKPFNVRELVLRVNALARRLGERREASVRPDDGTRLRWRALELDPVRHRTLLDGKEIALRPMEFRLLALLLEHPGIVYSRDQIIDALWGSSVYISPRTVDVHVRRLRQRLGEAGDAVETVQGFGYRAREA